MDKKRVAFHTLGCKLNFSETSTISRQLGTDHFQLVDFEDEADVYVVHTCSVTAVAEKKCRAAIRKAHKTNPSSNVVVMGCAAQAHPEAFEKMEGVTLVLGNNDKFRLKELLEKQNGQPGHISDISKIKEFVPSYSANDRTRSFFKVQDGCDYFCTFCSIPYMRGRSRSDSIKNTMKVAHEIAATEMREVILTGVNIGDFGHRNGEKFVDLLRELDTLDGIDRIRISSVEPELLTDEIIELVASSKKLLPHFHIPLQSGSDKILALMKRKYKREVFESRVLKIKSLMPAACIAADVIVGFPGETTEDFEDTYRFINGLDITYLHVFTYSERPGTRAVDFEGHLDEKEKRRRSALLHELSESKKLAFYNSNIGKTFNVLWESDNVSGMMHGWTENYIHVRTPFNPALINKVETVRLLSVAREKELIFDVENT
ncbi:MAG TPA: tRNA (N(6)-L-threonylcarbamoyladenosine(37)-C(2))-methylthiotransferase MtaB [Bacteroidales bacterium]|nr:tRNA (N(6)-L-threonylcarbamoyladenosine(37)-C(2))-methylthiotransferase MtaB [Bacteroidales bacterium]